MSRVDPGDSPSDANKLRNGLMVSTNFLCNLYAQEFVRDRIAMIEIEAIRQERDALATFGMLKGQDPCILPLRMALSYRTGKEQDFGMQWHLHYHPKNARQCDSCHGAEKFDR
jgi:hypothetical protein